MYDWPEVRWATDALWAAIADRLDAAGVSAPRELDRTSLLEDVWRDPRLLLSQTCGYPYATSLRNAVRLVGTPIYDVEGCEGPCYSSAIVVKRGASPTSPTRIAYNSADSLSGYVSVRACLREQGQDPAAFDWVATGAHRASIRALASGEADMAGIDAVCWVFAGRYEQAAVSQLEVVGWTAKRPGVPLITAAGRTDAEVEALRAAVSAALASDETAEPRRALLIKGLEITEERDYAPLAALGT
jgi:ABC-type phosphate/phosphonate transport system substrate-binding protein